MGFGDKAKDVPLQMADLLVGAAARHFRRERAGGPDVPKDRAIQSMDRNNRMLLLSLKKGELKEITEMARRGARDS
ncbi:MAG TPA: hypothetical protein VKV28_07410 [Candidatus Binataceae bacterium]|nr:hypothetical protein [Candidatus Binataceae bacterium]